MKDVLVNIAKVVGIVFMGLFVSGLLIGATQNNKVSGTSDEAIYNTTKNAFVSACKGQGTANENTCTCAWYKLDDYYKQQGNIKWYTDQGLTNRISSGGYNQSETDAFVSCFE